ncbi:MAG TPA: hypothetical protein VK338_06430 [Candidatus Nitrosocosmicus sp.]|nr:hypothetical protein [Candidatus Nitrosocosmicus sp.]
MSIDHREDDRLGHGLMVYCRDPENDYHKLVQSKQQVLEQSNVSPGELSFDFLETISRTPLDRKILKRERTSLVITVNADGTTYLIESTIYPTKAPITPKLTNGDFYSDYSKKDFYRYYTENGISQVGTILQEQGYKTERNDINVLTIRDQGYSLRVSFGLKPALVTEEDVARERKLKMLFPKTEPADRPYTGPFEIETLFTDHEGQPLSLNDEYEFMDGIVNYADMYAALLKAIYEDRGQMPFPATIEFEVPEDCD